MMTFESLARQFFNDSVEYCVQSKEQNDLANTLTFIAGYKTKFERPEMESIVAVGNYMHPEWKCSFFNMEKGLRSRVKYVNETGESALLEKILSFRIDRDKILTLYRGAVEVMLVLGNRGLTTTQHIKNFKYLRRKFNVTREERGNVYDLVSSEMGMSVDEMADYLEPLLAQEIVDTSESTHIDSEMKNDEIVEEKKENVVAEIEEVSSGSDVTAEEKTKTVSETELQTVSSGTDATADVIGDFTTDGSIDEELLMSFFEGDDKAEYYKKIFREFNIAGKSKFKLTWNWSSFLFSFLYFFYRKCIGWGIIYILFCWIPGIQFVVWLIAGATGNFCLYRHYLNKQIEIQKQFPNDREMQISEMKSFGGVYPMVKTVGIIGIAIIGIMAFVFGK